MFWSKPSTSRVKRCIKTSLKSLFYFRDKKARQNSTCSSCRSTYLHYGRLLVLSINVLLIFFLLNCKAHNSYVLRQKHCRRLFLGHYGNASSLRGNRASLSSGLVQLAVRRDFEGAQLSKFFVIMSAHCTDSVFTIYCTLL